MSYCKFQSIIENVHMIFHIEIIDAVHEFQTVLPEIKHLSPLPPPQKKKKVKKK